MTYATAESSRELRRPVELILFELGSQRYAYTNGEIPVTLDAITYTPVPGLKRSRVLASVDSRATVNIEVPQDNAFASLFKGIGIPGRIADVTVRQFHIGQAGSIIFFRGSVSTVTFDRLDSKAIAKIICRPGGGSAGTTAPRDRYSTECNVEHFGPECGLSRALFQENGNIDSVTGRDLTVSGITRLTGADSIWEAGYIEIGEQSRTIVRQTSNVLRIDIPFSSSPVGSAVFVPGCKHRMLEDCEGEYGNKVNFRGWPFPPLKDPFRTGIE